MATVIFMFKLPLLVVFMMFFFHCGGQGTGCHLTRRTLTDKRRLPRGFFGRTTTASVHDGNVGGVFINVNLFVFL